jgi:hypothetical protein
MAAAIAVLPAIEGVLDLALTIVFGGAIYGFASTLLWRVELRRVLAARFATS